MKLHRPPNSTCTQSRLNAGFNNTKLCWPTKWKQNHKNDIQNVIILPPPPQWLVRVCWLYATKAREEDKQEKKKIKKKKQHGERERTNQTRCRERRGENCINCRQGCCAFFSSFNGGVREDQRPTQNSSNSYFKTSPAVLSMWPCKK
jgi:hypothetical protein